MLIESNNRLNALVEVVDTVALIGGVNGVFAETEAHEDGFDAQHLLEGGDDRDGASRTHWDGLLAVCIHISSFSSLVGWQVDGATVCLTAMQRRDLHRDILGRIFLEIVLHQLGNLLVVLVRHQTAGELGVSL